MTATDSRVSHPFSPSSHRGGFPPREGIRHGETSPLQTRTAQPVPARKKSREMAQEVHPGLVAPRRDERLRSLASSFEEIAETAEEEECEASCSTERSPHTLPSDECSPFNSRRSNSLTNSNSLVSPKFVRRFPCRLQRGFSDPIVRRKHSHPSFSPDRMISPSHQRLGSIEEIVSGEMLVLPPIPEATTPNSPSNKTHFS